MMRGGHHSAETRAKISAVQMGEKHHLYGKHHSDETRAKISASHVGKRHSDETRVKMSAVQKGENNPMYGKRVSEETRAKISAACKGENNPGYGKHLSEEIRAKISAAHMGEKHPMYGKRHSDETRVKMSASHVGKRLSEETRAKLRGEKNPRWKGGISFEPYCPKFNKDLKRRIREFFGNQCVMCGKPNATGAALSCHHCSYDKDMCCNGKRVQFAALCAHHHAMTNNGDRQRWENMLHRVIDEIWDGKSYFTKEEYDHRKL